MGNIGNPMINMLAKMLSALYFLVHILMQNRGIVGIVSSDTSDG